MSNGIVVVSMRTLKQGHGQRLYLANTQWTSWRTRREETARDVQEGDSEHEYQCGDVCRRLDDRGHAQCLVNGIVVARKWYR